MNASHGGTSLKCRTRPAASPGEIPVTTSFQVAALASSWATKTLFG